MPSSTMPPGGGVESGGVWYSVAEWRARNGTANGTATNSNSADISAKATLDQVLAQYGLADLSDWAWNTYNNSNGSIDYVWSQLPSQPQFKTRFPAFDQLAKQGDGMTVQQYLNYEQTLHQMGQQYGVPQGFFTPERVSAALLAGQSLSEIQGELNRAAQVVADPNVQAWMSAHPSEGGLGGHQLTPGEIYAQQTDPSFSEQALVDRFTQAQIGGAALGYGQNIDQQLAQRLQLHGETQASAIAGFGQIANQQGLYNALPGNAGEQNFSTEQQASAQFGLSAADVNAAQLRAQQRKNAFNEGGQYSSGQGGFSGLGQAQGA